MKLPNILGWAGAVLFTAPIVAVFGGLLYTTFRDTPWPVQVAVGSVVAGAVLCTVALALERR